MLAGTAVALIRPLLGKFADAAADKAASAAADATGSGALKLYRAIRQHMTGDGYHQAILQGAEDQPDNEDRIDTLSKTVAAILKTDHDFAAAIADLVEQAPQATTITNAGAVAGHDVNISAVNVAGRDLTINGTGSY